MSTATRERLRRRRQAWTVPMEAPAPPASSLDVFQRFRWDAEGELWCCSVQLRDRPVRRVCHTVKPDDPLKAGLRIARRVARLEGVPLG